MRARPPDRTDGTRPVARADEGEGSWLKQVLEIANAHAGDATLARVCPMLPGPHGAPELILLNVDADPSPRDVEIADWDSGWTR